MVLLWVSIGTVEWCVIGFIVAMAVVAAVLKPQNRDEAMTYFLCAEKLPESVCSEDDVPVLEVYVADSGAIIERCGFDGLLRTEDSVVALAVTIKGSDITIKERITAGSGDEYRGKVRFDASTLRCKGNCHVQYISDDLSRSTAFSLLFRPGVRITRQLRQ